MRYWMIEAENIGMETETMERIVAIAILGVSTDRMPHIGGMDTNLILSACLKLELYERVLRGAVEGMEMGYGILSAIIHRRGESNVSLIVLQPVGDGAFVFFHLTTYDSYIATVINSAMPVTFQFALHLDALRIDHQSTGVAVKTMNYMSRTTLTSLLEIVVENGLYIQRGMSRSHRQYALLLLHHHEPLIFIDDGDIATLEGVILLRETYADAIARHQGIVKLSDNLAIHLYSPTLQYVLYLVSTAREVGKEIFQ